MRVLHLSSERTWRGGEQQIAYLFGELQKAGVEQIVAVRKDSAFEQYCIKNNIPHVACGFSGDLNFRTALQVKKYCRENNIELMHAHTAAGHAIAVLSQILGNSCPLVLSRRVIFKPNNNPFSKFKYNYHGIKKIICVSDAVRQVLSNYVNHPEKLTTINDGIDLARFSNTKKSNVLHKEYNLPDDVKIIANVAALTIEKDYDTFLNTIKHLQGKLPAKYFIIGEGEEREYITQKIKELNLSNDVIMTGFRNDLEKILPEVDLLLFTTQKEGFGSILLDAFACGVPVVATNAGGVVEIVKHNVNGLLAPVKDDAQLAKNVLQLMSNNNLRQQLINSAKEDVKGFSKEEMASKTLEVYQQVLKAH